MKLIIDILPETPKQDYEIWHTWFAWFPILTDIENNTKCLIWLCQVERKGDLGYSGWSWRYREKL